MNSRIKSTLTSAFAALALAALTVVGYAEDDLPGYPPYEPIDVCPQEIVGYESLGVVDFADPNTTLAGWEARPGVKLSRGEKSLVVLSETEDPYCFSPMVATFLSEDARKKTAGTMIVKVTLRRENTGGGQIFTAEEASRGYNEGNSTHFSIAKDDGYHDYFVPIHTKSPLLRVRFDIGNDEGVAEIARVELVRVVYKALKFSCHEIDAGTLRARLSNNGSEPVTVDTASFGADPGKSDTNGTITIEQSAQVELAFPQKKPFEEIELVASPQGTDETLYRRYFAFHEQVADEQAEREYVVLKNDAVEVRFAWDGSGAEIFRHGVRAAVIAPLVYEEGDGAAVLPDRTDLSTGNFSVTPSETSAAETRIVPILRSMSDAEVDFDLCRVPASEARKALDSDGSLTAPLDLSSVCGSLKFRLDGEILAFDFDAPVAVHAPVVRALGTMDQAILSGVEYLDRGEHSSSTADIETKERIRYAPPWSWTTSPFASVVTDRGSISLLYDEPKSQVVFAVPDFIDGDMSAARFNVCAKQGSGKLRIADPLEPIEEAILWSVQTRGLPELPTPPGDQGEITALILAGLQESCLKTPDGWAHAMISPNPPYTFKPTYGSDFVSTIWEITGELPEIPTLDGGGAHIGNDAAFLLTGRGAELSARLASEIDKIVKAQKPDGSFRYSGKYLRGHWTDYASGHCGNYLFALLDLYRLTKNHEALDAAVKGLEFMNTLRTPAGAQTWELSLHTPDVMGASRCVLANVLAYEATGEEQYLDAARRWALTGLPFVYQWENDEITPGEQPIMRYATIAVFGATNWASPNWMGRPVQWCGLDYAYALILLAKHESTLPWAKIAEGIVASAECQLMEDGDFIGLLPDSVNIETQERYGAYINPVVVWQLRQMIEGNPTNLSVVDCGDARVVSPYPARVEDGVVKISAKEGVAYQVMVNGTEIITTDSQGEDELQF